MSDPGTGNTIRRILVAVDASPHGLVVLEAAVLLAERLQAELLALFVEDVALLRAADVPFTREIGLFSTAVREIQAVRLERQLRAQAHAIRLALHQTAARRRVTSTFRVARGAVTAELLRAAANTDLVILGRRGQSVPGRRRVGSTLRAYLAQAPRLTLVVNRAQLRPDQPLLVPYDGSPAAQRALAAAAHLAEHSGGQLLVCLLGVEEEQRDALQAEVTVALGLVGLSALFQRISGSDIPRLASLAVQTQGALVLAAGDLHADRAEWQALFEQLDCPVWLVP